MSEPCIFGCKNDAGSVRLTNNQDRICQACAFDIHMEGHPRHMTAEEFRNFKKECEDDMKKCDKCGTGAGPRAKACPKCGEAFEAKEKKTKAKDKVVVGARGTRPVKSQGSSDAARPDRRKNSTKVKDEASQASSGAKVGGNGGSPKACTAPGVDNILALLLATKTDLQQELDNIELTITTIRKHSGVSV